MNRLNFLQFHLINSYLYCILNDNVLQHTLALTTCSVSVQWSFKSLQVLWVKKWERRRWLSLRRAVYTCLLGDNEGYRWVRGHYRGLLYRNLTFWVSYINCTRFQNRNRYNSGTRLHKRTSRQFINKVVSCMRQEYKMFI